MHFLALQLRDSDFIDKRDIHYILQHTYCDYSD